MTLYVVTEGEYSDYHIVGIYSTKEQAEKVKKYRSGLYEYPDIEEWELDANVPEDIDDIREYYRVTCYHERYRDDIWNCKRFTKTGKENITDCPWTLSRSGWFSIDIPCDRVKDEEHAKKIAYDKLAEILAMKEGI